MILKNIKTSHNNLFSTITRVTRLTVFIGETCIVKEILTLGTAPEQYDGYISQYTIFTSMDNSTWTVAEDEHGGELIFTANTHNNLLATNTMPSNVVARFLKLVVVDYYSWPSLRWEIIGCPLS